MKTIEYSKCDGCGELKNIIVIDEYGKGFCKKCLKERGEK